MDTAPKGRIIVSSGSKNPGRTKSPASLKSRRGSGTIILTGESRRDIARQALPPTDGDEATDKKED